VQVAPVVSESVNADREAAARDAATAKRYGEAKLGFQQLAAADPNPTQRSEYLFAAAPRFPMIVERIFLIGRKFCLGRAEKPSWLLGISMEDQEFGVQILERFQGARERHPLADDAFHYVALARLDLGDWELAIDAWERLRREYPKSEWAETAEFRVGLTMLGMSDGPRYDKAPLLSALERLRLYVKRHPTGNHSKEAQVEIERVEEEIAQHRLGVARYYLRQDQDYSADVYLSSVQKDFPNTKAATEALRLQNTMPRTSPPPAKPPPELTGDGIGVNEDRLRLAPAPIDDSW